MLVACRLAGLSALEAHYADVNRRSQYRAASGRAAQLGHLV
jgi:citrate lyase beta subunit